MSTLVLRSSQEAVVAEEAANHRRTYSHSSLTSADKRPHSVTPAVVFFPKG